MHYFDPNVAAEYGIAEAVIINHFQFWIAYNKRSSRNENEGRTWTYQSNKTMCDSFPYLSPKSIWSALDRLVKAGVIMKGNFNAHKYDRTLWYAFTLEDFWIKPVGEFHFVKTKKGNYPDGEPIPDDISDSKPNKETPAADAAGEKKPAPDPPKEKKPARPRAKSAPGSEIDHDWQRWVDAWFDFFKAKHDNIDPMFNPAQASALKRLREYLCKVATQVDGKSRDDCGFAAWTYILDNWDRLREWLQEQFDLTLILKKINDILNSLKNGTKSNRGTNSSGVKPGTSEQRVDAIKNY